MDKTTIKIKSAAILMVILVIVVGSFQMVFKSDSLSTHRVRFNNPDNLWIQSNNITLTDENVLPYISNEELARQEKKLSQKRKKSKRVKLRKPMRQVFYRPGHEENNALPTTTKFIGKLIQDIDSRFLDEEIQVTVSYGLNKNGLEIIPKSSILLGKASYQAGDRVNINFNKVIFPNGREYSISAQALDTKDYKRGIIGDFHNTKASKIATRIGLKMVAGMSDVLVEKEALGNSGAVTAKSTAKNALINGLGEVANSEVQEFGSDVQSQQNYVTVSSNTAVIINLTKRFKGTL